MTATDIPHANAAVDRDSSPAVLAPEERLARSRAKLRAWHVETYGDAAAKEASSDGSRQKDSRDDNKSEPGWLGAIFDILADMPAATVAARWLRRWWARHPLRATADLASAITREVAGPLAKRHPWILVGGALLAGVVLSRAKPWRWISGGAILASLMPRVDLNTLLHWFTVAVHDLGARHRAHEAVQDEAPPEAEVPATPIPTSDSVHFPMPPSGNLH